MSNQEPSQYKYQTLQVSQGLISPKGTRDFQNLADLMCWGVEALGKAVNAALLKRALEKLHPTIRKQIAKSGGVLVGIVYQYDPLVVDFSTKTFMYAYTMGSGKTYFDAYAQYEFSITCGTWSSAPINGWVKTEELLWITGK